MKRQEVKQQRTVFSLTPEDWDMRVNRALFQLSQDTRKAPEVIREKTADGYLAIIEYWEMKEEAETIRDEFILRGEYHRCDECPHIRRVEDRRIKHLECERGMKATTTCGDEACDWFYEQLWQERQKKPEVLEVKGA